MDLAMELKLDEEQVRAYQQRGDRSAMEALIRRRWKEVYRFCSYHVGSVQAEDVCQQVFIAVSQQQFDSEKGTFLSWLYAIALKQCRMVLASNQSRNRREKVAGDRAMQRKIRDNNTPEDQFFSSEQAAITKKLVSKLPRQPRLALELHSLQGLSFREIGPVLGVSTSTARRLTEEAINLLRSKMVKLGYTGLSVTAALTVLREESIEVSDGYVDNLVANLESSSSLSDPQSVDNESAHDAAVQSTGSLGIVAALFVLPVLAIAGASYISDSQSEETVLAESPAETFKEMRWDFAQHPREIKELELIEGDWNWKPSGVLEVNEGKSLSIKLPKISEFPVVIEGEIAGLFGINPAFNLAYVDSENRFLIRELEYFSGDSLKLNKSFGFKIFQFLVCENKIIQLAKFGPRSEFKPNGVATYTQSQKDKSLVLRLDNVVLDSLAVRCPGPVELADLETQVANTPISTFPEFSDFNKEPIKDHWFVLISKTPVKQIQRNQSKEESSTPDKCMSVLGLVTIHFRPVLRKVPCVLEFDVRQREGVQGWLDASWMQMGSGSLRPVQNESIRRIPLIHSLPEVDRLAWTRCSVYYFMNSVITTIADKPFGHVHSPKLSPLHKHIFLQIRNCDFDNLGVRYIDKKEVPEIVLDQLKQQGNTP